MAVKAKTSTSEAVVKAPAQKYRYVCEACTGVGFISETNDISRISAGICQSCHKPLGTLKPENFIKLD